jgi:hypothetical protein
MEKLLSDESQAPIFMTLNTLATSAGSHPRKIKRHPDGVLINGHRRTPIFKIGPETVQEFKRLHQEIYGNE